MSELNTYCQELVAVIKEAGYDCPCSSCDERISKIVKWFTDTVTEEFIPKSEHHADLVKCTSQGMDEWVLIKQLKAENEKLSAQVNGKELKDLESVKEIIRLNVAEARQEERVRIVEQINETAKKFYAINPLVLADEFVEAITADQQGKTV